MSRWELKDLKQYLPYGIGAFENKPLHYWLLSDPLVARTNDGKLLTSVVVPMEHEEHSFPDIVKDYHQHQLEQAVLSSNIA